MIKIGNNVIWVRNDSEQYMKYLGMVVAQDMRTNKYVVLLTNGQAIESDGADLEELEEKK